jgi:hypothetical protein
MADKWSTTISAASFAADAIPSSAVAALITFNVKYRIESAGFERPQQVQQRVLSLPKLKPTGFTALWDVIDDTLSKFPALQPGDAIFLVTDGEENRGTVTFSVLLRDLLMHGIRVFLFLVPTRPFEVERQRNEALVSGLAESSGGDIVSFTWDRIGQHERALLMRLAPQIRNEVESFYRVQLELPAGVVKRGKVRIDWAGRPDTSSVHHLTYSRYVCVQQGELAGEGASHHP